MRRHRAGRSGVIGRVPSTMITSSISSTPNISTIAAPGSGNGPKVGEPPSGTRIPIWIPFVVIVVVIFAAIPVIIVVVRKRKKRLLEKEAMKLEREAKKKKRMEKREKGRLRKRLDAFFSRKHKSKPKPSDEKVEAQLGGAEMDETSAVKKSVGSSGKSDVKNQEDVRVEIQAETGKSSIKAKGDSRVKKPDDVGGTVQGEMGKSSVKTGQEIKEAADK